MEIERTTTAKKAKANYELGPRPRKRPNKERLSPFVVKDGKQTKMKRAKLAEVDEERYRKNYLYDDPDITVEQREQMIQEKIEGLHRFVPKPKGMSRPEAIAINEQWKKEKRNQSYPLGPDRKENKNFNNEVREATQFVIDNAQNFNAVLNAFGAKSIKKGSNTVARVQYVPVCGAPFRPKLSKPTALFPNGKWNCSKLADGKKKPSDEDRNVTVPQRDAVRKASGASVTRFIDNYHGASNINIDDKKKTLATLKRDYKNKVTFTKKYLKQYPEKTLLRFAEEKGHDSDDTTPASIIAFLINKGSNRKL